MSSYKYENGGLTVYSNTGVKDYCNQNGINLSDFNEPVIIATSVTDCSRMFWGCKQFNQPVVLPINVTDCSRMFWGCETFNQPVLLSESVVNYSEMFYGCSKFNQTLDTPEDLMSYSAILCKGRFPSWDIFKQPIHIPRCVHIPESAVDCTNMFSGCENYRQTTVLPTSVTNYMGVFDGCPGEYDEETRTFTPRLENDSDQKETSLF